MADARVEKAALQLLHSIPDLRSRSVLELGCGDGAMLERLAGDGVNARGTTFRARADDYIRTREHTDRIKGCVDDGIDLNKPLPYGDATFDVVYSVEVLEHVESHKTFVSEAARVLKPGGWLVLTTPNLNRLSSRMQFAVSGVHALKRRLIPRTTPLARMEEFHCYPADFTLLHYLLWQGGLRIEDVAITHCKALSVAALALFGPVWLGTKINCSKKTESLEDREARRDMVRWMTTRSLLTSENIALRARKTGGHAAGAAPRTDHAKTARTGLGPGSNHTER